MPKLHVDLEVDDVVLIPAGSGATIEFKGKTGKRTRVVITSSQPVTITHGSSKPSAGSSGALLARRPVPTAR